jgi:uncharacterized FAD-dependent dehydrogenase
MNGIDLLIIKQKHLGSDCLPEHITGMSDYIRSKQVVIHTEEEVEDILVENRCIQGIVTNRKAYLTNNVILAPGRV